MNPWSGEFTAAFTGAAPFADLVDWRISIAGRDITGFTIAGMRLTMGRTDPDSQPESSTASIDLVGETDRLAWIVPRQVVTVEAQVSGVPYRGPVWTGTVSDVTRTLRKRTGGWYTTVQVTAVGPVAKLARSIVGDTPWPQELDGERVDRVLTAAGFPSPPATDPALAVAGDPYMIYGLNTANGAWSDFWGHQTSPAWAVHPTATIPAGGKWYLTNTTSAYAPGGAIPHLRIWVSAPCLVRGDAYTAALPGNATTLNPLATFVAKQWWIPGPGVWDLTGPQLAGPAANVWSECGLAIDALAGVEVEAVIFSGAFTRAAEAAGTVQVIAQDVDRQPAGTLTTAAAQSGAGVLWETRTGYLVYDAADYRRENIQPGTTFPAGEILADIQTVSTAAETANTIEVTYGVDGDTSVLAVDAAGVAADGNPIGLRVDTTLAFTADALVRADAELLRRGVARERIDSLTLYASRAAGVADPRRISDVLFLRLGAPVRFEDLPATGTGDPAYAGFVEGIEYQIDRTSILATLTVSSFADAARGFTWEELTNGIAWAAVSNGLTWYNVDSVWSTLHSLT